MMSSFPFSEPFFISATISLSTDTELRTCYILRKDRFLGISKRDLRTLPFIRRIELIAFGDRVE